MKNLGNRAVGVAIRRTHGMTAALAVLAVSLIGCGQRHRREQVTGCRVSRGGRSARGTMGR